MRTFKYVRKKFAAHDKAVLTMQNPAVHLHRIFLRKARTLWQQPPFVRAWVLPVWVMLGISKSMIGLMSFQGLSGLLGQPCGLAPWVPLLTERQQRRAAHIGRVVRMVATYTPWTSNCFAQALVARTLLCWYRIPYTLFFGLRRDPHSSEMKAHTWLACGPINVTGGACFGRYAVVSVFMTQLIDKHTLGNEDKRQYKS